MTAAAAAAAAEAEDEAAVAAIAEDETNDLVNALLGVVEGGGGEDVESTPAPAAAAAAAAGAGAEAEPSPKLTVTAGMTEEEKAARDRELLAASREADTPLHPANQFPSYHRAWLTDAQLDRAMRYGIRVQHNKYMEVGTLSALIDIPVKINYPISYDALEKRVDAKRTEERFKTQHICFEPVCYKQSHYICIAYDTRNAVKTGTYRGRITICDAFGETDIARKTAALMRQKYGDLMAVHVVPEITQSDSYQCSIWCVGFSLEYLGAATANTSDLFSMTAGKVGGESYLYDLSFGDPGARYANAAWISGMRNWLRQLSDVKNSIPSIEKECVS